MNNSTPIANSQAAPNAFTLVQPVCIRPTTVSKALATRINKNTHATAWCGMSNSQKAPR